MKHIIYVFMIALIFSGCWMMPYKNDFSCNGDIGAGTCGMVRDNYNYEANKESNFTYQNMNNSKGEK